MTACSASEVEMPQQCSALLEEEGEQLGVLVFRAGDLYGSALRSKSWPRGAPRNSRFRTNFPQSDAGGGKALCRDWVPQIDLL